MDAVTVALVAAMISLVVGTLSSAATAWSAHRATRTAREGRIYERRADAYLHVLTLAEREGHWDEAWVANFGKLPKDPEDPYDDLVRPPEPDVSDRATMSALIAAHSSSRIRDHYAAWRAVADELTVEVKMALIGLNESPYDGVSEEFLKPIRDEHLPKEQTLRRELAEAIASELGHR